MALRALLSLTLFTFINVPTLARAQSGDLGAELTGYTRFLVYPHLQKGLESMARGERDRALHELERARSLAPGSVSVALHLAAAYRKFGASDRAEALLRDHLKRTPADARLQRALAELRLAATPAATPATQAPMHPPAPVKPAPTTAIASTRRVPVKPAHVEKRPAPLAPVRAPDPDVASTLRENFSRALEGRRFDEAQRYAEFLVAHRDGTGPLLDELTYRLASAGATAQATRMLVDAYPFERAAAGEREHLLDRLIVLINEPTREWPDWEIRRLRQPLETTALRSRQAALWTLLKDCDAVRSVLGDESTEYGYDDWMRLADCAGSDQALAHRAYEQAHARRPGGRASRELAYRAYAAGAFGTALELWKTVTPERLSDQDLIGAATTASAAGDNLTGASVLHHYRERGFPLDHRYWSLLARITEHIDSTTAVAALERAIELEPTVDDYTRMARLERDAHRQVPWLEKAVALAPENASIHAALGYAYERAGHPDVALAAFERANTLDPDQRDVQIELGYRYWHDGRFELARHSFERAWRGQPHDPVLTRQLVYVHQRLGRNDDARWYAERVLDTMSALDGKVPESAETADQRFGMRRLHEDLGRRLTLTLDGWSGTGVGTGASASQARPGSGSYAQVEADVRLGREPVRDGSTLSAYARIVADGGFERRAVPSENAWLGAGLRWKPWRTQILYLAAETQHNLEDARHDFLVRASASFFNGGRFGDDWHASGGGWLATNLYLDAGHFFRTGHSVFTADYRASYHRKVGAGRTVEPYGHVQVNGDTFVRLATDARGGVGVRWNIWHGGSRYDAPPRKISLGLEYQQAIETYLEDRNGLFFTLGTRW
jgi:adsorption protein A